MAPNDTTLSVDARVIDWPAASRAAACAAQAAEQLGVRVNVAVVDASGLLAAFVRMPGAPLHSIDIAIDKAYTAAVQQGLVLRPRFVAFGGGLPIVEGGRVIGGIGVSGGSEAQDETCARAGLAAAGLVANT